MEKKNKKQSEFGMKDKTISDEEYWSELTGNEEDGFSKQMSDINLDFNIKFFGINTEIYSINMKGINGNPEALDKFLRNLKKTIRMLDEEYSDHVSEH